MRIISRDEWGANGPTGRLDGWPGGQPSSWTIHYEAVDVAIDAVDYSGRVRSIQQYHQNHGYFDIAYNFVVAPNGQVFEGRGWDYRSAAQASGNPYSIAVCYLGGPSTPLTDPAANAINVLIAQRPMEVLPHRHWIATACPGQIIVDWLDAGRPSSGVVPPPAPPQPGPPVADQRPMVRFGARGAYVVEMQDRLKAHGFDAGVSDGIAGPTTIAALKAFQESQGITADGVCGPITWGRLDRQPNTVPAPSGFTGLVRQGDRGAAVAEIQEALYRAGEDAGPADGIAGPRFDAAVRRFQQSRNLQVDGIVGPQTRAALGI